MSNNDSNNTSWWSWSTKGVSNIWWHVSSYFKPSVKQIKDAGELGSNDTIALEQTSPVQEQKSTSSWLGNVGGTIYSAAGSFGAGSYNLGSYVLSSGWSVGSAIYSAGYGVGAAGYNAVGSTYSAIFSRNKLTNAVEEPKDQGLDHISKDGLKPAEEVVNTAAVEGGAKPAEEVVNTAAVEAVAKPVVEVAKPVVEVAKPVVEVAKPVVEVAKPVVEAGAKPVVEVAKPVVEVADTVAVEGRAKTKVATLIAQVEYGDLCDSALFAFPKKWANDVIASYHQAESEPQSHYERVLEGVDQAMLLNYF